MSFEIWPEIISGVVGVAVSGVIGSIQHRRETRPDEVVSLSYGSLQCDMPNCRQNAIGRDTDSGVYLCERHFVMSEQQQVLAQPRQAKPLPPQRQPQVKRQVRPIYEEETVRDHDRRQYGSQPYDPYDLADLEEEYLDDEEEEYYGEDEIELCVHNRELGNCKRCYEAELERRRQLVADQRRERVQQRQVQRSRPVQPQPRRQAKPLPQQPQRRVRR